MEKSGSARGGASPAGARAGLGRPRRWRRGRNRAERPHNSLKIRLSDPGLSNAISLNHTVVQIQALNAECRRRNPNPGPRIPPRSGNRLADSSVPTWSSRRVDQSPSCRAHHAESGRKFMGAAREGRGEQRRPISTIPMLSESDTHHNCLPFVCDHTLANLLREHFFEEIAYRRIPSYTRHNCYGARLLID